MNATQILKQSHTGSHMRAVACRAGPRTQTQPLSAVARGTMAVGAAIVVACTPAFADLNKFEAATGGEFGMGTAGQYGEADLKDRNFSGQDLRRSNFTSADCRRCKFVGSKLNGDAPRRCEAPAWWLNIHTSLPWPVHKRSSVRWINPIHMQADFTDADVSDVLWDRAVINEAILRNAVLQRTVFTSSDLGGADIYGADFTNALVDRSQQLKLCKYADGVNTVTGVSTRKSLGCNSRRAFKAASPSSLDGPQVSEDDKEAFVKSMPTYRN